MFGELRPLVEAFAELEWIELPESDQIVGSKDGSEKRQQWDHNNFVHFISNKGTNNLRIMDALFSSIFKTWYIN